jgi:multidrug resistance efflux pump
MSSNFVRLGLLTVVAILLAAAIAFAQQERKGGETARSGHLDVFNPIEGRTLVVTSRPDGARVAKGDVVCELDATDLQDRLTTQDVVVRAAQADAHGATIAREVAVMAVTEYQQGTFIEELASVEGEIRLAESDLARAEDRVDWARRMFEKGYTSLAEKVADELMLKKARFALEQGQSKKKTLIEYSRAKTIKALKGAVEAARARELAKQAGLERDRSLQKKLLDHIRRCKVTAPAGGRIEYPAPIGPGAVVHDGQLLFRVVPDGTSVRELR